MFAEKSPPPAGESLFVGESAKKSCGRAGRTVYVMICGAVCGNVCEAELNSWGKGEKELETKERQKSGRPKGELM